MVEYISTNIKDIAHELGRAICGKIDHVVGVSLRKNPEGDGMCLYVDIDDESAREHVPQTFSGQIVYCRLTGTPRFL